MKHGVKIEESRFLTSYMLACLGVIALCCVNYVCAQSLSEELNNFNNGLDALPQVHYVTTSAPSNHDHQTFLVKKVPIWPVINVVNDREILEAITNKLYLKAGLLLAKTNSLYKAVMMPEELEGLLSARASVEIILKNYVLARKYLVELSELNDSPEVLFRLWAVTCKAKARSEISEIVHKICTRDKKYCQIAKENSACN